MCKQKRLKNVAVGLIILVLRPMYNICVCFLSPKCQQCTLEIPLPHWSRPTASCTFTHKPNHRNQLIETILKFPSEASRITQVKVGILQIQAYAHIKITCRSQLILHPLKFLPSHALAQYSVKFTNLKLNQMANWSQQLVGFKHCNNQTSRTRALGLLVLEIKPQLGHL